jgi:hypothetical protein
MTTDMHPETTCERCGGPNVLSWHAPSPLWNAVLRDPVTREDRWSIICPRCFAELAEESVVGSSAGWHWAPCGEPLPEWDMGDGRIWDPERCLWVGGSVPPLVGDAGADRPRSTGPGVSTSQQTLAEALEVIRGDDGDVRRGLIVLAPDLAADAILATEPGSRLTTTDHPDVRAGLALLRAALIESDRRDGHGGWCNYLVAPCDCGYYERHEAARAALSATSETT